MSATEDSLFDGLDRTFLDLSSKMAEPFCWAYGMVRYRFVSPLDPNKFDNSASKVQEIGTRVFIGLCTALAVVIAGTHLLLLTAVVLGGGCQIFRCLGVALQKDGFTHVRGSASEKKLVDGQATAMTWNIRGYCGGVHYKEGGVIHWRSRIDSIVEKIKDQDPDVLVLQGIYDTALVEALIEKLHGSYAHFYTHLGANTWSSPSGCMVLSKCAVASFSHTEFANNDRFDHRGFDTLEIKASPEDKGPSVRIIGAELVPGEEAEEKRRAQVAQIVNSLAKKSFALPTFFVGNINAGDRPDEGAFLSKYFYHSYRGTEPTHTDQLANQWGAQTTKLGRMIAYISLFRRNPPGGPLPVIERNVRLIECKLVRAFDEKNPDTQTALSDNHGLVAQFKFRD